MHEFSPDVWRWQNVSVRNPMHVMVARQEDRLWMKGIQCHVCARELPAGSIIWLDERASMVAPPLLFMQMARYMSLPALVMLGYELCGHYSRDANNPHTGPVVDHLPPATNVEELASYIRESGRGWQTVKAHKALEFVADHAVSAMEGFLATMYSLPTKELGYGMGPVILNERVNTSSDENKRLRFPDLMFSFAPVGINYDGGDHLDLKGLVNRALDFAVSEGADRGPAGLALRAKQDDVRAKVVDDIARNRQLAASGRIVFPVTKEDIYERGALDELTRDILRSAQGIFGADISEYMKAIDNTSLCNDRYTLIESLLSFGASQMGGREQI